jgi:aspartyl protease family protein
VVGAGVVGAHRNIGEMLKNLMIWLVIILGLATGWLYQDQAKEAALRVAAELVPGTTDHCFRRDQARRS